MQDAYALTLPLSHGAAQTDPSKQHRLLHLPSGLTTFVQCSRNIRFCSSGGSDDIGTGLPKTPAS